jgi:hypothetical protein
MPMRYCLCSPPDTPHTTVAGFASGVQQLAWVRHRTTPATEREPSSLNAQPQAQTVHRPATTAACATSKTERKLWSLVRLLALAAAQRIQVGLADVGRGGMHVRSLLILGWRARLHANMRRMLDLGEDGLA